MEVTRELLYKGVLYTFYMGPVKRRDEFGFPDVIWDDETEAAWEQLREVLWTPAGLRSSKSAVQTQTTVQNLSDRALQQAIVRWAQIIEESFQEGWTLKRVRVRELSRKEESEYLEITSYQPLVEVRLALQAGPGAWPINPGSLWPTATIDTRLAKGFAQLVHTEADRQALLPPEQMAALAARMQEERDKMDDLTVDAMDYATAQWLKVARTKDTTAIFDVNAFMLARGLKPNTSGAGRLGGFSKKQKEEHLAAIYRVACILFQMDWDFHEETGKKNKKTGKEETRRKRYAVKSRFLWTEDQFGQLRTDGTVEVEKFVFKLGNPFSGLLTSPSLRQAALLSERALQYDPYRQKAEKRLTRYFSDLWRIRATKKEQVVQPHKVGTLLKRADITGRPDKARERLEKALDKLLEDAVIAAWQYEGWEEEWAQGKGWFKKYQDALVVVEAPETIKTQYEQIIQPALPAPKPQPEQLGPLLRQARQARGLTQLQVAEQLGISSRTLIRLEQDGKASRAMKKRVELWLGM